MRAHQYVAALAAFITCVHGMGITVPGTKWCGPGNTADNFDDLGIEVELDTCCRAHDNCEQRILPNEQRYGLSNIGVFPIFSCGCEAAFRQCLVMLHNMQSAALGRIYFSTTSVCFAHGPPTVSCEEQQWDLFKKRCKSYKEDNSQPSRWQFYDLPFYTHLSEEDLQQTAANNQID
ncbi:phospholipase A2-like [Drosophila sulfurigaster albostrigata]|uniref:phospholipase A2 n=1 Tax=Drosophila sulfurigaster albostrigata TaxID=89887 RepID=UPI002D21CF0A|nr:phospholipase A2 [Drosophila sulfurigaster albostrigata]XP_062136378.1 phospholipase A2-like [Drosophila sulfurigaster albostrigata]